MKIISSLPEYNLVSHSSADSSAPSERSPFKLKINKSKIIQTNLSPLKSDVVSFSSMKKSQFDGFNLAVVEKYKAPIEKFKSIDDFNEWTNNEINKIIKKEYPAKHYITTCKRESYLKEWIDHVKKESNEYTPAIQLVIFDDITKDLKSTNEDIPPVLNKKLLSQSILELNQKFKKTPKSTFSFINLYNSKLKDYYMKKMNLNEKSTQWLIIPSLKNDPENFEENVNAIKVLSKSTWCTKSIYADKYLINDNFHIYFEKGEPQIGIRFQDGKIAEIQLDKNNNKIPVKYLEIVNEHIKNGNYILGWLPQKEINEAQETKTEIEKIKTDLKDAIKNKDNETIFNYFNIKTQKNNEGKLIISEYKQPHYFKYNYNDLGINENDLLSNVVGIENNAYFSDSNATDISSIEFIGGNADFRNNRTTTNISGLKQVGKNLYICNSKLKKEDFKNVEIKGQIFI